LTELLKKIKGGRFCDSVYHFVTVLVGYFTVGGVDVSLLSEFRCRFSSDAKSQLAQCVCVKHDLLDVLRSSQQELTAHVYNHKVHYSHIFY